MIDLRFGYEKFCACQVGVTSKCTRIPGNETRRDDVVSEEANDVSNEQTVR